MAQDFDKICRTCMVELEDAKALTDILSIEGEVVKLGDILSTLTCFEITENDNLPQQICAECRIRLINAFSFQQQCYKSNKIFRTVIESQQIDEYENMEKAEENLDGFYQSIEQDIVEQQYDLQMITNICTTSKDEENVEITQHQEHFKIYSCKICNKTFDGSDSFMEHNGHCFNCLACGKIFNRYFELKMHIKKSHSKKYGCDVCGKTYSKLEFFLLHQESHNAIETECETCGKMLNGPLSLKEHMICHSETMPHICATCGSSFVSEYKLKDHVKRHKYSLKTPIICKICDKEFARSAHLAEHLKKHSDEGIFFCTICEKTFISKSQLTEHSIIHSDKNPYVCKVCDKRFTNKRNVRRHEKIHAKVVK